MSDVLWIKDKDDLAEVLSTNSEVVIDFTAPSWCRPCQQFSPHFETAAEKSDATFVAVDVDKAPWATLDYGVRGVPTVMLYRDGEYQRNLQERTVVKLLAEINN